MASARPPRNGPICRHCIPLNAFSLIDPAGVGDVRGVGLAAKILESAKTTAAKNSWAKNRTRKLDVIIRLRWKACGYLQLESRGRTLVVASLSETQCGHESHLRSRCPTGADGYSEARAAIM